MLACGLRRGEALGLCWRDLDLEGEAPQLHVRQALTVTSGGGLRLGEVKTPASRRTVYLPQDVVRVLREHRERQRALFGDNLLMFVSAVGTPVHHSNLRRAFLSLCDVTGVRRVSLHDLRRTYASLALARHVPVKLASPRMGHATPGSTLNVDRQLYDPEQREAALSLDDLLAGRGYSPN